MIFVTCGTQLPFDRLIRAIDEIAPCLEEEIIAQCLRGKYIPCNIKVSDYLCATEYMDIMSRARLIVSHAGTGTIISALVQKIPIIVMPRLASLGEHRSEHQIFAANKFEKLKYIYVAHDTLQLFNLIQSSETRCRRELGDMASDRLILSLKEFLMD